MSAFPLPLILKYRICRAWVLIGHKSKTIWDNDFKFWTYNHHAILIETGICSLPDIGGGYTEGPPQKHVPMPIHGWDILVTMALCMKKHHQNIFAPILIAEYGIIEQTGKKIGK